MAISSRRFIDMMYKGIYNGKRIHESDLQMVINRAFKCGNKKLILTNGNYDECIESINIISQCNNIFATAGCHPTRCKDFEEKFEDPEKYLLKLSDFIVNTKNIIAIGECGLDYDRLHFCPKHMQLKYFEIQFKLVEKHKLPMFLHHRNCHNDFMTILNKYLFLIDKYGAVIHSFTGTKEEADDIMNLSSRLYIGINGCSLKKSENLDVVQNLPIERLMIETDAPWCEIKPTHASFKYVNTHFKMIKKEKFSQNNANIEGDISLIKGRNEPCAIIQIFEVLNSLFKDSTLSQNREAHQNDIVDKILFENTEKLFF